MANSYYKDAKALQLGRILLSGESLSGLDNDTFKLLHGLHLGKTAETLQQVLDSGDEPHKAEILAASFLGAVAGELAACLEADGYPSDTPQDVLRSLADALTIRMGLAGDELDELEGYVEMMEGYAYEGRDERLQRIAELQAELDWLKETLLQVGALIPGRRDTDSQQLINRFSFWQSAGYTADYLYLEGLSDELMCSNYLRDVLCEDLAGLDAAPETCRALMARTVRLCNMVAQDGSPEKEERLRRIDNVILDHDIDLPDCEWDFTSLPEEYLQDYMMIRAGIKGLKDVAPGVADDRMYRCAVYVNPDDINYVPAFYRTEDMVEYALSYGSPDNLRHVPEEWQSATQVALAVSRDPLTVRFANKEFLTFELASSAVIRNGQAIRFLDKGKYSKEQFKALVQLALMQDPGVINHIPHEFLEPEVISIAVRKDYRSFDKLSGLKITPRVMLHMLLVDPRVAEFMPQRLLDDPTFRQKAELIGNGWERFAPAKDVQPA